MEFGERTREWSPSHAGKDGPHLSIMEASPGFQELRRQYGLSHEVQRGAQGASRVATGKSVLHASGQGEHVIALESW